MLLAWSLLHETKEAFLWAFQAFVKAFHNPPSVLITDGDVAMAAAFAVASQRGGKMFGTIHLFCVFHLFKNFYKHLHPFFQHHKQEWHQAASRWWRVCLETDVRSQMSFGREWASLEDLIQQMWAKTGREDAKTKLAKAWLERTGQLSEHWAARWTWSTCTYGLHSTGRAESVNSAVSDSLRASDLLTTLVNLLEAYSRRSKDNRRAEAHRLDQNQQAAARSVMPLIASVQGKISPYAYKKLCEQGVQAIQYSISNKDDEGILLDNGYFNLSRTPPPTNNVPLRTKDLIGAMEDESEDAGIDTHENCRSRMTTQHTCTCQYLSCYGIPCRHILRLLDWLGITQLPLTLFSLKWHRNSTDDNIASVTEFFRTASSTRSSDVVLEAPRSVLAMAREA